MDLFRPEMSVEELKAVSMLGLAHVGDAVYELMTRTELCAAEGHTSVHELHRLSSSRVNAVSQAAAANIIQPLLTEEERTVFRRGRNARVNSVPRASGVGQYHAATGLEALFGWLYLQGRTQRLSELFGAINAALPGKD